MSVLPDGVLLLPSGAVECSTVKRFSVSCSDVLYEGLVVRAGVEGRSVSQMAARLVAAGLGGAGEGVLGERESSAAVATRQAAVSPGQDRAPSLDGSRSPSASDLDEREAAGSYPVTAAAGVSRSSSSRGTPRRGRDTTGAGAGLCAHRVRLDAYCKECG